MLTTDGFTELVTTETEFALFTICISDAVLVLKFPSPLYTALITCVPTASAAELVAATPFTSATVAIAFAPSLKRHRPARAPTPGSIAVTFAVNVALCPKTVAAALETIAVLVPAAFTT